MVRKIDYKSNINKDEVNKRLQNLKCTEECLRTDLELIINEISVLEDLLESND